jgi:hypothetical protein
MMLCTPGYVFAELRRTVLPPHKPRTPGNISASTASYGTPRVGVLRSKLDKQGPKSSILPHRRRVLIISLYLNFVGGSEKPL